MRMSGSEIGHVFTISRTTELFAFLIATCVAHFLSPIYSWETDKSLQRSHREGVSHGRQHRYKVSYS